MFSGLFQAVPDALVIVDRDGRIAMANRNAEAMFGYAAEEMTGCAIEMLMPAEARARHLAFRSDYMYRPKVRPMGAQAQNLVGLKKNGCLFPVEIALSPLDDGGPPRFLASIRDVSQSHLARQGVARSRYDALLSSISQSALKASDEQALLKEIPALLTDALHAGSALLAFLHAESRIEIVGAVGYDLLAWDAIERMPFADTPLGRALTAGQPLVIEDLSRQDERERIVLERSGSVAVLPIGNGDDIGGLLAVHCAKAQQFDHDAVHLLQSVADVVASLRLRRRMEEQLAHAQRLDAIGQLTGGIAHDLNNLLTVISGNLQLLQLEPPGSDGTADLIESALRSVGRGGELTSKLLSFARRQRLSPQSVDLVELLTDVGRMLERTLGKHIALRLACARALPRALVDPAQLDTAIVNLALNARDAMPNGGEISIRAEPVRVLPRQATHELAAGDYVAICVADTGLGMAPDTLARAMEPFFTTKDSGDGCGLGLSMVYGFVKQSGGHIAIGSELGYGTQATLYLPIAHGKRCDAPARQARWQMGNAESILLVDDDTAVLKATAALLEISGYRVRSATDAAQALALLERHPDTALLFSDVVLGGGMDGRELVALARQRFPGIACLLCSAYSAGDSGESSLALHAIETLPKPYLLEALIASVRRALAG